MRAPNTGNGMLPGDPRWAHGPKHPRWKGKAAGLVSKHGRVKSARGRASHCIWGCEAKHYDWANLTGNYDDIWDYAQMCRLCHNHYDGARRSMEPGFTRQPGGGSDRKATSEAIRAEMRALYHAGLSQVRVAEIYGVSRNQVREAIRTGNLPPREAAILSAAAGTIGAG